MHNISTPRAVLRSLQREISGLREDLLAAQEALTRRSRPQASFPEAAALLGDIAGCDAAHAPRRPPPS